MHIFSNQVTIYDQKNHISQDFNNGQPIYIAMFFGCLTRYSYGCFIYVYFNFACNIFTPQIKGIHQYT